MRVWGLACLLAAALALVLGAASASATTPTPLGCTVADVESALATGGDYQFDCTQYVQFVNDIPLTSDKDTTIAGLSSASPEYWYNSTQSGTFASVRFINVTGGSLTLTNINLVGGRYAAGGGATGTAGGDGTAGSAGTSGSPAGTNGTAATSPGGPGATGSAGQGGQIFISSGATVTLNGGTDYAAQLAAGPGGAGGGGGAGGSGGYGDLGKIAAGGNGAAGTAGGIGGTGGAAQGGSIYVSSGATLNVTGTTFSGDSASAGGGGAGGGGGRGGSGGTGGTDLEGTFGPGGTAVGGATGGGGGTGGVAQGGAIYNAGTLNISSATFSSDTVGAGTGGVGGAGGAAGNAGETTQTSSNGGDGGAAGTGGLGGTGSGAAVYNAGTMTLGQVTFSTNTAVGGNGGSGGQGGFAGCPNACLSNGNFGGSYGTNAPGANGGDGGAALDASIASASSITGCLSFSGSTVNGGAGGSGGLGGIGGYNATPPNPTGAGGGAGAAGTPGAADPTVNGSAACPTLSVADNSILEPSTGQTATLNFTVTLSAATQSTTTVQYATFDGTGTSPAVSGTDYTGTSGTATIPAGSTTATIPVTILNDGFEPNKTFTLTLSNPSPAKVTLAQATATGTIHGLSPLQVTVKVNPLSGPIQQDAAGPTRVNTTATVTLKNIGTTQLTNVALPSQLTVGWHSAVSNTGSRPVIQAAAPTNLNVGTLNAGASSTPATYTLQVSGDGDIDVQALATAALNGATITGFGTTEFKPDSQLLVFTAKVGAEVHSQTNPSLIQAGTSFLINLTLENRSNYRTIVVDPIYPGLDGNAADGAVLPATVGYTGSNPTGNESEVEASPYIEIKPGQTAHYLTVVRTGASDAADTQTQPSGGTRAKVTFDPPTGSIVNTDNTATAFDPDKYTVMTPASSDIEVGIDDSGMTAAPWAASDPRTWLDATWSVSKGLSWGLWRATYGAVRGILWDLPSLVVKGVYNVSTASLDYMDRMVELWTACDDTSACLDDLVDTVTDKIIDSYAQAPELLTQTAAQLKQQVDTALTSHFAKLEAEWDAGDWRDALTELTAEATDTAVNVALMVGPAVLARSPKAAAAWNSLKAATFAKVDSALAATVRAFEPAKAAFLALSKVVKPGYWFTEDQMASLFGVSDTESSLLSAFTERLGINVVLRSRASQAIKYLEEGLAVVKPYWIKTKNVNELDVQFLGYNEGELGRVVFRPPISASTAESRMTAEGLAKTDPEWSEVLSRLKTRTKEYHGEYKQMQKWNKAGKVRGKWPWGENGVNPAVQADSYSTVRFRLNTQGGAVVPEIFEGGKWKFITGDIDLIAITKANGSALSDVEHVSILKQLSNIIGAQHPESATWINDGKFWFKAKKGYLTNEGECCLAQYGPDGKIRAVEFNEKLSDPTSWTKLNYRIFWKGGYEAGPGS